MSAHYSGAYHTPQERAGVGHVGDGHVGAEARCPRCNGTDRTAETDFHGGVVLRCGDCAHVEPIRRRTPAECADAEAAAVPPPVPIVRGSREQREWSHMTAEAWEWVEAIPMEWVTTAEMATAWGVPRTTCNARLRRLESAGQVQRERRGFPSGLIASYVRRVRP